MIRQLAPHVIISIITYWIANIIAHTIRIGLITGQSTYQITSNTITALQTSLPTSVQIQDVLISLGAVALTNLIYYAYRMSRKTYRDREEYGSAKWAKPHEMAAYTDRNPKYNLQMTASEGLSLDTNATYRNLNVLMLGGSGARKTSCYVLPNIKKMNMNIAVTDPKGEIYEATHAMLEDSGEYDVHCLDLVDLTHETQFNPLKYIDPVKPDIAIMRLVTNIIANTKSGESARNTDDFWVMSEKSLLTALIAYVYYTKVGEHADQCNLVTVTQLAAKLRASENDEDRMSEVDCMMQAAHELYNEYVGHETEYTPAAQRMIEGLRFAADQYNPFTQGAGETKKSIIISLAVRLAPLNVRQVQDIMYADNIGIDHIGRGNKKVAIFLKLPDEDTTFNFIAAIFYQCLFENVLQRTRTMPGGRLPQPLHCYLDEFANVGKIPNFERLISTIRSRNVSASIILQTLGQLKTMYKDGWETITGNCDNILFYGGFEKTTTEWVSALLGKQTIDTKDTSQSKGRNGSYSINYRRTGRELMQPNELAKMDNNYCIYILRGVNPFYSRKVSFDGHIAKPVSRLKHSKQWQTAH